MYWNIREAHVDISFVCHAQSFYNFSRFSIGPLLLHDVEFCFAEIAVQVYNRYELASILASLVSSFFLARVTKLAKDLCFGQATAKLGKIFVIYIQQNYSEIDLHLKSIAK